MTRNPSRPQIYHNSDYVMIEGKRITRPERMTIIQWQAFWECVLRIRDVELSDKMR